MIVTLCVGGKSGLKSGLQYYFSFTGGMGQISKDLVCRKCGCEERQVRCCLCKILV